MRARTLLILVTTVWVVYALIPDERKRALRGRFRELGWAITVALVLYWAVMLSRLAWNRWAG